MFTITTSTHPSSDLLRPSLVLSNHTTGKKYLIGSVPEGAQRIMNESKLGMGKVDEIFLTGRVDWSSTGGLPGFILTSSDQGRTSMVLNYCGADKFLKYVVSSWRYFLLRIGIKVTINEFDNGDVIKNEGFDVIPVSIAGSSSKRDSSTAKDYDLLSSLVDKIFPLSKSRANLSFLKLPDIEVKSTQSCNYIIDFHPLRGRFMVEKVKLLNVPTGPAYRKLIEGENVTLSDGTVITPDQVVAPTRIFEKVIVLDIPSEDYLSSTLLHDWGDNVQCIYHFLGDEFPVEKLQSSEYINFFNKFSNAKHLVSHSKLCSDSINFTSSALLTLKLKSINNELFRLPQSNGRQNSENVQLHDNVSILNSLQSVYIYPDVPAVIQNNNSNTLDTNYWDELYDREIKPLNFKFHNKEEILSKELPFENSGDVEIITLGTGSAVPSKYRNVISTVLRIPTSDLKNSFNSIILDAGENTIGSIKRLFKPDEFINFFKSELSLIYLSHLHADHHLGIISLIDNFNIHNTGNRKLYLICPWLYDSFLKEWFKFNANLDGLKNIIYINCELFEVSSTKVPPVKQYDFEKIDQLEELPRILEKLDYQSLKESSLFKDANLKEIKTCKAIHCEWAYSVSFEFKNGFKVSYSGDTRPSLQFVQIGQGSNLLIHEATLEDALIAELMNKKHTTMLELKHVLLLMNVENLVLTHFSQRYPKLPTSGNSNTNKVKKIIKNYLLLDRFNIFRRETSKPMADNKIVFAFDNMWFKLGDIHLQSKRFKGMDMSFLEKQILEEEIQNDSRKRSSDEL